MITTITDFFVTVLATKSESYSVQEIKITLELATIRSTRQPFWVSAIGVIMISCIDGVTDVSSTDERAEPGLLTITELTTTLGGLTNLNF